MTISFKSNLLHFPHTVFIPSTMSTTTLILMCLTGQEKKVEVFIHNSLHEKQREREKEMKKLSEFLAS
jgi:hypothetical protein